jgi:hypothetical protein
MLGGIWAERGTATSSRQRRLAVPTCVLRVEVNLVAAWAFDFLTHSTLIPKTVKDDEGNYGKREKEQPKQRSTLRFQIKAACSDHAVTYAQNSNLEQHTVWRLSENR